MHDARWVTPAMFGAAVALAYVTPGPVLIVSTFVDYQVTGIAGALVATLGAFLAPWGLAALLAQQLGRLAQHPILRRFGRTAAPAAIAGLVLVVAARTRINPAVLLIVAGTLGYALASLVK